MVFYVFDFVTFVIHITRKRNLSFNQGQSIGVNANANENTNANRANESGPVPISANANDIELTKDINVPSEVGSILRTAYIILHMTYCLGTACT